MDFNTTTRKWAELRILSLYRIYLALTPYGSSGSDADAGLTYITQRSRTASFAYNYTGRFPIRYTLITKLTLGLYNFKFKIGG